MNRTLSLFVGIALGGLAGAVLAIASLADAERVFGRDLAWFDPYFRAVGTAMGGLILVAAILVIGVGVGRWRRPATVYRRRSQDVRW